MSVRARILFPPMVLLLLGCGPPGPTREGDPSLDADVRVSPTPAVVGESRVFVQATDAGVPLEGGTVRLRAEPAAAEGADGAGAIVPVPAPDGASTPEPGRGGVAPALPAAETPGDFGPVVLRFPAPGRWRLVVEIESADGRRATLRTPLAVVGGPPG